METKYKGYTIEHNPTGWYSVFISGKGFLKADTVDGCKNHIDGHEKYLEWLVNKSDVKTR